MPYGNVLFWLLLRSMLRIFLLLPTSIVYSHGGWFRLLLVAIPVLKDLGMHGQHALIAAWSCLCICLHAAARLVIPAVLLLASAACYVFCPLMPVPEVCHMNQHRIHCFEELY